MKRKIACWSRRALARGAAALWVAALASVSDVGATSSSGARGSVDTDTLANVLATAFLAQSLSLVCAEQDKWFLEDTRGPGGDGRDFAEHIKREVLAHLSEREAGLIVINAANAARAMSLGLIHVMGGGTSDEQIERMAAWCNSTAKPLVKGILAQHEIRHDLYDQMLSQAKQ